MLPCLLALALCLMPPQASGRQHNQPTPIVSLEQELHTFSALRRTPAQSAQAVLCLHNVGRLGTKKAVDALLLLIPELHGSLKYAAVHAIALSDTPYSHAKLRLLARHRTQADVRRQACLDLSRGSVEDLIFLRDHRLKREKDLRIRGEILHNLIDRDVPHLERIVLKAAKSKDHLYAGVGVYGIGELHLVQGLKTVETFLTSTDVQLRLAALQAFGTFRSAKTTRLLLNAYAKDGNLALRPDIERLLLNVSSAEEIAVLISEGLNSKKREVVAVSASVISIAAGKHAETCAPALLKLLDSDDSQLRDVALEGLARAHPEEAISVLSSQLEHSSGQTRSTAIWAISQFDALPDSLMPQITGLAQDSQMAVRLHVAQALGRFQPSDQVLQTALQLLEDPQWPVRAAAITSLITLRRVESLEPLICRVEQEHGRLRDDAVEALCQLTAKDYGASVGTWRLWLKDVADEFTLPEVDFAAQQLAELRSKRRSRTRDNQSTVTGIYHGISVPPGGVVFVLDISESMALPYDSQRSYYEHFSTALSDTIHTLNAQVEFNIVLFSGGVKLWKTDLVAGSVQHAREARDFLSSVRPSGPTNLHAALMSAFRFQDVQTIFLLSDGESTIGPITSSTAILLELERANRERQVVIHTIAAGDVQVDFMAALADANGGRSLDLTQTGLQQP